MLRSFSCLSNISVGTLGVRLRNNAVRLTFGFFEAETGLEKCQIRSVETLTFRLSVQNVRQNADYLSGSPPIGELREWMVAEAVHIEPGSAWKFPFCPEISEILRF